jgi:hypothetical protein
VFCGSDCTVAMSGEDATRTELNVIIRNGGKRTREGK